jgi:hypothetical protein
MPFDNLPVVSNPVRDVIDQAIDRIETDGWCQGSLGVHPKSTRGLSVCLLGAIGIYQVRGSYFAPTPDVEEAKRLLAEMIPRCGDEQHSLFMWNDDPQRTRDEVIDLLKRVRDLA